MSAPLPSYTVEQLAAGSYRRPARRHRVASLVRCGGTDATGEEWQVELLDELPPFKRPDPFVDLSHTFRSLPATLDWLGIHERGIADAQVG